jgi:raffinose/stachyose/melibiose transport system permease protein
MPSVTHKPAWSKGFAIFLLPGMIFFLVIIGVPFLANIGIGFTKWNGVGKPVWVGLANYGRAIADPVFWASFRNNLLMIFAVVVIPTVIGLLLSTFLFDFMGRRFPRGVVSFFRAGFYLPQILPVAIAGVVWGWILDPNYGTLNWMLNAIGLSSLAHNWLGDAAFALPTVMFTMIWFQIGYPLVIFMAALQRIDPQILEAADMDGANWGHRFRIITALIQPEIGVVVLTTTIFTLKLFAQIFVLTRGGPGTATIVPSYFAYQNFFERANVGYGSAISTIMTLIIIALTAIFINVQSRQERGGGLS